MPTYTVKPGDNLSTIASNKGISLAALLSVNPQITNPDLIYPNQVIMIPDGIPLLVRVQQNETLSEIAARYGLTWQVLYAVPVNRATIGPDPDLIFAGMPIVIPSKFTSAPSQQTTGPPSPPPTPAPTGPVAPGLARVQQWLGAKTVGLYFGVETANWRVEQFGAVAAQLQSWGVDYAMVKLGGDVGIEWYDGQLPAIRQAFLQHGVGMAPFIYCNPGAVGGDIQIATHCANVCGGVVFDIEDGWGGKDGQLAALLSTTRQNCPDACLILTGYGDPRYHFGVFGFPHSTLRDALHNHVLDAYQPQWYFGVWDIHKQHGAIAAIDWGDQDVASIYGNDCVIQPAINCEGVALADFGAAAQYLKNWHAGVTIWEYQQVAANPGIISECKKGLQS